jgi:hypothetical protein
LTLEALEHRTLLATTTWIGADDIKGNSNWSDPANWSNGVPGPSDTARFAHDSSVASTTSVMDQSFSIAGLLIDQSYGNGLLYLDTPLVLSGSSEWDAGIITLESAGSLTNNGTLAESDSPLLAGNGTFTNNGTITQAGAYDLELGGYTNGQGLVVTLNNTAAGVIDLQSDAGIRGGNGLIVNAGTIEKTGGTKTSAIFESLNNTGTIDAESGTIRLVGANTAGPNGTDDTNGTFKTAAGAFIELAASGQLPFIQNGTFTGTGTGTILLDVNGIDSGPAGSTFSIASTVTFLWSGATINVPATTTLTYNGSLSLDSNGIPSLAGGGTFVLKGTLTESGTGYLNLEPGNGTTTTLDISPGSTLDLQSDSSIYGDPISSTSTVLLNNAGTIEKTGGTGTSTLRPAMLNNTGTIGVFTGTLKVNVGGQGYTTFTNSGGLIIAAGSAVQVPNNYTQTAAGYIRPILAGPASFGQLLVSGQATLAGTLQVGTANGFSPTVGQSFPVLAAGSVSGTFASLSGQSFTTGVSLNPVYSATGVVLRASVSPPLLTAAGQDISATAGQPFGRVVAIITDTLANVRAADLRATIDWGDGQTSSGTLLIGAGPAAGTFAVSGSHTYTQAGSYAVSVTVLDTASSQSAIAHGTATVAGAPPPGSTATVTGAPLPSSTALSVVRAGRAVWLTTSVDGAGGPATGSVEFFDTFRGKHRLVAVAPVSGGVARRRIVLRRGMHALQAVYLGDARYSGSISAVRLRRVVGG